MNRAVVALGSNIDPDENIEGGLARLAEEHRVLKVSPLLRTRPLGPTRDQPDFVNGAVFVETALPRDLFEAYLKEVEVACGRPKGGDRWGPRTLDMDLVLWNGRVVDHDVHRRGFLATSVAAVLNS